MTSTTPAGNNTGNSRNGMRTKTVLTDNVGPVEIEEQCCGESSNPPGTKGSIFAGR